MIFDLFGIGLVILFFVCFKYVSAEFCTACDVQEAKTVTEHQMAARFISIAIKQYEIRNQMPDIFNASIYEKTTDMQDDLVEEYYLKFEQNLKNSNAGAKKKGFLRLV